MKGKHYLIFSSDSKPGGISSMLKAHVIALMNDNNRIPILIPEQSNIPKELNIFIKKLGINDDLLAIITFSKFIFYLSKIINTRLFKNIFADVDGCFVHNARLIKFVRSYTNKPIFAVNHTGKTSQKIFYKEADLIFSVNKKITNELIDLGIDESKCIYCPNVLLEFPEEAIKKQSSKEIVIGALGRMVEKKGFEDFIKALTIMKEKGYSFRAVIAGDGVLLNQLKDLATDLPELEFTGWITNKNEFFKKIDIFCQPSLFEPFGLTIIEAMAMAIPVISTDCDGPRDIIVSEKNGFIIPIRNSAFMSQVIIKLIGNSLLRNKIGEEGRKLIFKKYRINSLSVLLKKNLEKYYSEHSR